MDTISISLDDPDFASLVTHNASTMGHYVPPRDRFGRRRFPFRGYKTTISTLINGQRLYVGHDPVNPERSPLLITFHCSHFANYSAIKDWLMPIFSGELDRLDEGKITRLDCTIDVPRPYELFRETVDQPRVTFVSEWKSKRRSLYLGRPPKQTIIYEKKVSEHCLDETLKNNCKVDKNGMTLAVRIEVSTSGKKVPISSLSQLHDLLTMNPFEHLQFKQVDEAIVELLSNRKRHTVEAFQHRKARIGFPMAKREFNGSGHFARDVGRYLKPFEIDLYSCWRRRISRFLSLSQGMEMEGVANETMQ